MVVAVTLAAAALVVVLVVGRSGPAPPPAAERTATAPTHRRSGVAPDGFSAAGPLTTAIPADARPASDSAAIVANLVRQIRSHDGHVALNATSYTATLYTVGAHQAKVDIGFDNCQGRSTLQAGMARALSGVPLPRGAVGSAGSDSEISIYQPASNHLWEFWKFQRSASGRYTACWGGEITDVSRNPGVFPYPYGATASGLALAAFVLRTHEVSSRRIDHALGVNVISARHGAVSWPADRTDGNGGGDDATDPAEGQRFRLNPKLDLARLHLNPLALLVARALQRYGMIVTDQSTGAVAIQAQDPDPDGSRRARDPYAALAGKMPTYEWLAGIPWDQLQAMPLNYGRAARR